MLSLRADSSCALAALDKSRGVWYNEGICYWEAWYIIKEESKDERRNNDNFDDYTGDVGDSRSCGSVLYDAYAS